MLAKALALGAGLSIVFTLAGCANGGVSQAELDQVRALALEARTMAAEARDIALRAERKADDALAEANSAKALAQQALNNP